MTFGRKHGKQGKTQKNFDKYTKPGIYKLTKE